MKGRIGRTVRRGLVHARGNCGGRLLKKPTHVSVSDCFRSTKPLSVQKAQNRIQRGYARFAEISQGVVCLAVCIEEHVVKLLARTEEDILRTIVVSKKLFFDELTNAREETFRGFLLNLTYKANPYVQKANVIDNSGLSGFIGSWINSI